MKKINILLIEPDSALAQTYAKFLRSNNYNVRVSATAQGAVDAIESKRPELIILELQLSGHNGFEFLYEIRSYSDWQTIPVIINTIVPNQALNINSSVMDQFGIKAYLYKPQTNLKQLIYEVDHNLLVSSL